MIKVYTGLKGFAATLFLIAAVVLILAVFSWGIAEASRLLMPVLIVLSYLLIVVFLLGILPATFFKALRPSLAVYSVLMSHALGVSTWMMAFFFVISTFGLGGIFLALLFQFLAPIAIAGAMLKGSWPIAGHLSIWIGFTYGMRFYSQWLLNLNPRNQEKRDIIDIEALEVRDH